ncbi:MAG: dehydrogenase [Prevotella sp.]|nr:dehydrogenase [Prevotella sp.]
MADGYLEKHHADYEARKAAWLKKKSHLPKGYVATARQIQRPEDEAL